RRAATPVHRGLDRRHVRRPPRQRDVAFPAHPAGRRVRPPAHLPRPQTGRRGELRRTAAAVRTPPLLVGGLRKRADLGGRRGVAAHGEVGPPVPAGPPGAPARPGGPPPPPPPPHPPPPPP